MTDYLDPGDHRIVPCLKPNSRASEFAQMFPQPLQSYEQLLTTLTERETTAWIVLSRVRVDGAFFRRALGDLESLGSLESFEIAGDVDLYLWKKHTTDAKTIE